MGERLPVKVWDAPAPGSPGSPGTQRVRTVGVSREHRPRRGGGAGWFRVPNPNGGATMLAMANTAALQEAIDWVRRDLAERYGVAFQKRPVQPRTGKLRTFNAVAADGTVVATVTNSSGPTSGGKKPVGKVRGAIAELYFLSLVDAPSRALILTDPAFLPYVMAELDGALPAYLKVLLVPLPEDLSNKVHHDTHSTSNEMTR